ncbi:MAG: VCBS repeat-containing protein [Nanoarchaeota archaeon]|nr:VCBS repeat-containing protein [Nanoarchaeota archaeon]
MRKRGWNILCIFIFLVLNAYAISATCTVQDIDVNTIIYADLVGASQEYFIRKYDVDTDTFNPPQQITGIDTDEALVAAWDFDLDGDLDIVTKKVEYLTVPDRHFDVKIYLYENHPADCLVKHTIQDNFIDVSETVDCLDPIWCHRFAASAIDPDNDGLMDILFAVQGQEDNSATMYHLKNTGGLNFVRLNTLGSGIEHSERIVERFFPSGNFDSDGNSEIIVLDYHTGFAGSAFDVHSYDVIESVANPPQAELVYNGIVFTTHADYPARLLFNAGKINNADNIDDILYGMDDDGEDPGQIMRRFGQATGIFDGEAEVLDIASGSEPPGPYTDVDEGQGLLAFRDFNRDGNADVVICQPYPDPTNPTDPGKMWFATGIGNGFFNPLQEIGTCMNDNIYGFVLVSAMAPPDVVLDQPADGATLSCNPDVTFRFTATDDSSPTMSCDVFLDNQIINSPVVSNGNAYSFDHTIPLDFDQTWDLIFPSDELVAYDPSVVFETNDGGFMVAGMEWNAIQTNSRLLKLEEDGSVDWDIIYKQDGTWGGLTDAIETNNGDIVFTGVKGVGGGATHEIFVVRLNSGGGMIWNKVVWSGGQRYVSQIIEMNNGNFLIAGSQTVNPLRFLQIVDGSNGNPIGPQVEIPIGEFNNMIKVEGGYAILGYTAGDFRVWKVDENLNEVLDGTINLPLDQVGYTIDQASDGDWLIEGSNGGGNDMIVVRVSPDLSTVRWTYEYTGNGNSQRTTVQEISKGDVLISNEGFNPDSDYYFIRLDRDGNIIWKKYFDKTTDLFRDVIQTSKGDFVAVGGSHSGNWDGWIIRFSDTCHKWRTECSDDELYLGVSDTWEFCLSPDICACTINQVFVFPDCASGNSFFCEAGEEIDIYAIYTGNCPTPVHLQVSANDSDKNCIIDYINQDVLGMEIVCANSPCQESWTIPDLPEDCYSQLLGTNTSTIWDTAVGTGTLEAEAPAYGTFRFNGTENSPCAYLPYDKDFFIVRDMSGLLQFYRSKEDGTFEAPLALPEVEKGKLIDVADVDLDFDTDVITYDYEWGGQVKMYWYENNPFTCFEEHVIDVFPAFLDITTRPECDWSGNGIWCLRESTKVADFNNDGYADILLMESDQNPNSGTEFTIFFNDQNGNFTGVISNNTADGTPLTTDALDWPTSRGMAVADYNMDQNIDMVIMDYNSAGAVPMDQFIYLGDGTGNFLEPAISIFSSPASVSVIKEAHTNGDDIPDIILGLDDDDDPGQAWVYFGNGGGGFNFGGESFDVYPGVEGGSTPVRSEIVLQDYDKTNPNIDMILCENPWPYTDSRLEFWEGDGAGHFSMINTLSSDCSGRPLAFPLLEYCGVIEEPCTLDSDCCQQGQGGYPYNQYCVGIIGDEHCCPVGMSWNGTDCTREFGCGNGIIEPGETCEFISLFPIMEIWGDRIFGCHNFDNFITDPMMLKCNLPGEYEECLFNTSKCTWSLATQDYDICGNGIIEANETCDFDPDSGAEIWDPIDGCWWFDSWTGGNLTCIKPGKEGECHFNTTECIRGDISIAMQCGRAYHSETGYEILTTACNDSLYERDLMFECEIFDCAYANETEHDPDRYACYPHGSTRKNIANQTIQCVGQGVAGDTINTWCPEHFYYHEILEMCLFDGETCDRGQLYEDDQYTAYPNFEANCSLPLCIILGNYTISYQCLDPDDPFYPDPPDDAYPKDTTCCHNFSIADYNDSIYLYREYGFYNDLPVLII